MHSQRQALSSNIRKKWVGGWRGIESLSLCMCEIERERERKTINKLRYIFMVNGGNGNGLAKLLQ